jgi:hypothetical protein
VRVLHNRGDCLYDVISGFPNPWPRVCHGHRSSLAAPMVDFHGRNRGGDGGISRCIGPRAGRQRHLRRCPRYHAACLRNALARRADDWAQRSRVRTSGRQRSVGRRLDPATWRAPARSNRRRGLARLHRRRRRQRSSSESLVPGHGALLARSDRPQLQLPIPLHQHSRRTLRFVTATSMLIALE